MLMQTGDKPIASRNNLLSTVAWRINGRTEFALEGSIFIAGAVTQWLRDGLNFFKNAAEIEKLAAYLGFSGEIQENDVDIAAAAIGEHSRWDYINAVADHNLEKALSILDDMLAMETAPALIMSDITTNLRKLAMARQIVVGGGNARDVAQAARVPQFRAQALARRANFMSDRLIAAMYAEVIRTDIALKSGRTDDKAQLEILTARISADPRRSRG